MKNILFGCSANKDRSILAEEYFSTHPLYKHHSYVSVGFSKKDVDRAKKRRYDEHVPMYAKKSNLMAADIIYVMEAKHKEWIHDHFLDSFSEELDDILNKIVVLHIEDDYNREENKNIDQFKSLIEEKIGPTLRK